MSGCGGCCPIESAVESAVEVDENETLVAAANASRKDLIIQNIGASAVNVYLTQGNGYLDGGTLLQPGDIWHASQVVGFWPGAVYAITAGGGGALLLVTEET
jgi:hypothetical protein